MNRSEVETLFKTDMFTLLNQAHQVHRQHFTPNEIQLSSLLSIKTGGCPENCAYCPQSAHYETGVQKQRTMSLEAVTDAAKKAKASGVTRFCMGAAWREVKDGPEFDHVLDLVRAVRGLDLEVCCTLGMLNATQAERLKDAGLYAYNHNIDSSRAFYEKIITTRTYDDRLRTIANVREAGITVCTGGIIGMGETEGDRIDFLWQLTSFSPHPESVTINALIPIEGTPLAEQKSANAMDLARVIAAARVLMPTSRIRLSAGRKSLSAEGQFLCFFAGANSVFLGEKLLTSPNPTLGDDQKLFDAIGARGMELQ